MSTSSSAFPVPSDSFPSAELAGTPAAREPVRYTGELQPDPAFYDGRLPHAAGVHHIQVFRARRTGASGDAAFTYNHQPYLVWWRGRFYLQFLRAPRHEHDAPTITLLVTSADGYAWTSPQTLFPEYQLPAFKLDGATYDAGMSAVMHQRMGFYVAPNGRLLTLGFYGICPDSNHSPNAGNGVGRVVREVRADGTFGDIHFIRYNRHAGFDETNTSYPFYTASGDAEFRAACEALLADRLATLQWWEEDRGTDGFFAIDPGRVPDAPTFHAGMVSSAGAGKAFSWFTRPDGVVVGLWKNQYAALSSDRGKTWTPIVRNHTLRTTGAKTWGQRTSDGKYVIVYNHSATRMNRFPISALVGRDGHDFPTLLCLGGEVPPRRFFGHHKGVGMHYFRGISEGSEQPPGGDLWIAYSVNKEDIWVLRARVPLTWVESEPLPASEFGEVSSIAELSRWNFHLPQWARARLVTDPVAAKRVLELRDEDPWDYAQAERIFPAAHRLRLRFRCQGRELPPGSSFEIELQSQRHHRPVRLKFVANELACEGGASAMPSVPFALGQWRAIELECDCNLSRYTLRIDGTIVRAGIAFAEPAPLLERIVFRTGPWRGRVPAHLVDGDKAATFAGEDLPDADAPMPATVFWIDELTAEAL